MNRTDIKRIDAEAAQQLMRDNGLVLFKGVEIADENSNGINDLFEKYQDYELTTLKYYQIAADSDNNFWDRARAFLTASNKAGRKAKMVKDFILLFTPYGPQIDSATSVVAELIKEDKVETMDKPKLLSKTIWSAIIIAITAILYHFGIDLGANPEIVQNVYELIYLLAGSFGLYGLRDAIGKQIQEARENNQIQNS